MWARRVAMVRSRSRMLACSSLRSLCVHFSSQAHSQHLNAMLASAVMLFVIRGGAGGGSGGSGAQAGELRRDGLQLLVLLLGVLFGLPQLLSHCTRTPSVSRCLWERRGACTYMTVAQRRLPATRSDSLSTLSWCATAEPRAPSRSLVCFVMNAEDPYRMARCSSEHPSLQ